MGQLVLYASRPSRAFVPFWLLEEIGVPFRTKILDLGKREQKRPDYLALNPMGKVPALTDDGVVITETPAICLHLADRYSYGTLAPRIEDADRGSYLRWMVFSTAVFEPGAYLPEAEDPTGVGWGSRREMLAALEAALKPGPYLLGERFTAADVMLGGLMSVALFNKRIPESPVLGAYNALIAARPAYQRALKHNGWA